MSKVKVDHFIHLDFQLAIIKVINLILKLICGSIFKLFKIVYLNSTRRLRPTINYYYPLWIRRVNED